MLSSRLFSVLGGCGLVLLLSACAARGPAVPDPVAPPSSFSQAGSTDAPARWWTAFDTPALNAAVDTALTRNFSLQEARQRLRAAQAVADRESAALFPQIDASAGAEATRRSDASSGTAGSDPQGTSDETLRLGAAATYEVDLWGRLRSRVNAEQARVQATAADLQTARLSVSAELTRTWLQRAEAQSQIDLIRDQIATNRRVLQLLEERFRRGQIRSVDVLRQRQLVEASREDLAAAQARAQVLDHQWAVLQGQTPAPDSASRPAALPDPPPLPDTGIPLRLVERRPDVQAARFRVRAADQDLAAAIQDRYPRLTLTASAATEAGSAGALFDTWVASVAGDVLAPLFYGGRLSAEVDRASAVKRERVAAYGQTVLEAFREVEDALALEAGQREQVARIDAQLDLARRAYEQLRIQYLNGAASYLDVLTALRDVQRLERTRRTARLLLLEDRIALYRALAGPIPPSEAAAVDAN